MSKSYANGRQPDVEGALPLPGCTVWSARKKVAVIKAIRDGSLSREQAYHRYMLSEEELVSWEVGFDMGGIAGLRLRSRRRRIAKKPC